MDSVYEKLAGLTLLHGLSKQQIADLASKTSLQFITCRKKTQLYHQGQACENLDFILSGEVRLRHYNNSGNLIIKQYCKRGFVIGADLLFGSARCYPYDVMGYENTCIMRISKSEYMRLLRSDDIYMYNYLNFLSSRMQRPVEVLLQVPNGNLISRLAIYTSMVTYPQSYNIEMEISFTNLSHLLGVNPRQLELEISQLMADGILEKIPQGLRAKSRERLIGAAFEKIGSDA